MELPDVWTKGRDSQESQTGEQSWPGWWAGVISLTDITQSCMVSNTGLFIFTVKDIKAGHFWLVKRIWLKNKDFYVILKLYCFAYGEFGICKNISDMLKSIKHEKSPRRRTFIANCFIVQMWPVGNGAIFISRSDRPLRVSCVTPQLRRWQINRTQESIRKATNVAFYLKLKRSIDSPV